MRSKYAADIVEGKITASEAATALGLNPYETPHDYWLVKTGRKPPFEGNDATRAGQMAEPLLQDWAKKELGLPLTKWTTPLVRGNFAATPDLFQKKRKPIGECKTAGLLGYRKLDDWGEAGTDQVPKQYLVQTHMQMYVSESGLCYLAALLGDGRWTTMYEIPYNEDLALEIVSRLEEWHAKHLVEDVEPEGDISLDTLKTMDREEGLSIEIGYEHHLRLALAKQKVKAAEEEAEAAKRDLLMQMGDAEISTSDWGKYSFKSSTRRTVDLDRLRAEHPEVAAECTRETPVRTLRASQTKEQKALNWAQRAHPVTDSDTVALEAGA